MRPEETDAAVGTSYRLTENSAWRPRSSQFLLAFASLLLLISLLRWGGFLLVSDDALPAHADEAIVLQGSILGEKARLAGASQLVKSGIASRMLISIPKESYWGQAISPIAHSYIERTYGSDVSARTDFCETGTDVNSTEGEAQTLIKCIQREKWNSIIVVTSDYHTRRARLIWGRAIRQDGLQWAIHGVSDPEFSAHQWWRQRLYAKTWLGELSKLIWTFAFGS